MWITTQLRLCRLLRQYRKERNLDTLLQTKWKEGSLLGELFAEIEARINFGANQKFQQKQAEYLALQNQINPHFLYNTLEAIRSDALLADCENIAETTEALATFYRYTISNVQEYVTFSDELDNVENYFTVQQSRFGDKIAMEVEIENEHLLEARMPKLILQPLVENAIVHGIEGKLGKGTVRIVVENSDRCLFLHVSDDGVGFSEDRVFRLNEQFSGKTGMKTQKQDSKKRGGIALGNVNSRIQLMFGKDYGLRIYSAEGVGTECVLTMPLSFEKKGNDKSSSNAAGAGEP